MVKGLQRFREYFGDHPDSFVVIGGVACDEWLGLQGLRTHFSIGWTARHCDKRFKSIFLPKARANFFALDQPLICFSLLAAAGRSGYSSVWMISPTPTMPVVRQPLPRSCSECRRGGLLEWPA
jgi:hypothetical protein